METIIENLNKYLIPAAAISDDVVSKCGIPPSMLTHFGLDDGQYVDVIPVGQVYVRLDFKVWGKHDDLRLMLTDIQTGKRFSLSVIQQFIPITNGKNDIIFSDLEKHYNFSQPYNSGKLFSFWVVQKGSKAVLQSATLLEDIGKPINA